MAVPTDPYIGQVIDDQYHVVGRIGTGGMGAVYKAEQPSMQRHVAIKILHKRFVSRADLLSRFRREARAMSRLNHPNIARVFVYGQLPDGAAYMVMELLEGRNLARIVQREGAMEPKRAVAIIVQVCDALEHAHRTGMVHRDLKPENIFLCMNVGQSDYPKLLDFGLAKVTERELHPNSVFLTREGAIFGTPEFMSPEQAQGKVLDARSDIYSLSIILYEMLTTQLPFFATEGTEFMKRHIYEAPIPLSKRSPEIVFPAGLEEAILKAMEKDPAKRFQSAADFADALKAAVDDRPKVTSRKPQPAHSRRTQATAHGVRDRLLRSPWTWFAISGLVLAALTLVLYAVVG